MIAVLVCASSNAQDTPAPALPATVLAALQRADIPESAVSMVVRTSDGRRLDWRADQPREAGSLIKLLTTLVALDRLGPGFRFRTELLAEPPPQRGGRWQLSLRGGGDPGFRYEDLRHLLRAALAAGVRHPQPGVVIDRHRFADEPAASTGIRLDPDRVSGSLPWPLLVEQSAVQLVLPAPGAGAPLLDPPFPLQAPVRMHLADGAPCPEDWLDRIHLELAPAAAPVRGTTPAVAPVWRVRGDWPDNCPQATVLRAPLAPDRYADLALASLWQDLGQRERLHLVDGEAPETATLRFSQDSRPLAELVHDINKYSNNVMARMLFLDLAAEAGYLPARPRDAAAVVAEWLQAAGLVFPELVLENGSGLSHREVISAAHLAQLLALGLTSAASPEFVSSLAIPGQEGVLRNRFRELAGAERLRLKTGTLDGVRGLAGYVLTRTGAPGIVVCIINGPHAEQASGVQAALLAWALRGESATAVAP